MKRTFTYIIEKDEDGFYVADVPELSGCHTQAKSLDELETRMQEAVQLYLVEKKGEFQKIKFIGVQQIEVMVED